MEGGSAVKLQSMGSSGVGERRPIDLAVLQKNGSSALGGEGVTVPRKSNMVNKGQTGIGTRQLSSAEAGGIVSIVIGVPFYATVVSRHGE